MRGQITTLEDARAYVFGGHGRVTLRSKRTGDRFTFRLSTPQGKPSPIFVKVLNGPDNGADFAYLGTIWPGPNGATFAHGKKSRVSADAPSVRAFDWFVRVLATSNAAGFDQLELYHEGTCGRCGRALTVPESITTGLGPICATR